MTIYAAWQQSGSYPAAQDRASLFAAMAGTSSTSSILPRDGCVPDGINPLAVSASTGMVLNVNAGQAMIAGYTFTNDTATTVTIPAAGVSARTDVVVARVRDTDQGDASTSATIEVVTNTTTAPTRSILLAQIAVGANVTSISSGNITDKRSYTASAGGAVPVPGAFATPSLASGLVDGQPVWDSQLNSLGIKIGSSVIQASSLPAFTTSSARDALFSSPTSGLACTVAGEIQVYRSGAWRRVGDGVTDAGQQASTAWTNGQFFTTGSISFNKTFASPPVVQISSSWITGNTMVIGAPSAITTTGCTYRIQRIDGLTNYTGTTTVSWLAVGS